MQPERRCYPRKELQASIDYSSEKKANAKDISIGGICIITHHQISRGTVLFLVIPLKDKGIIEAIGEVIWTKKISKENYATGIEFFSLNDFSKEKISAYVSAS